jgi:hypothetical protein
MIIQTEHEMRTTFKQNFANEEINIFFQLKLRKKIRKKSNIDIYAKVVAPPVSPRFIRFFHI